MSSRVKGGATRVSIPSGVRKTIENIKELTGNNHSEDEIYAMLKECNMDPNETAQKLLLLDTFHEVKRRRDRRKENLNKEPVDQKWKPGTQARSNRVGRVNYIARYSSQDVASGRSTDLFENASKYPPEKANVKVLQAALLETNGSSSIESKNASLSNGASDMASHDVGFVHEEPDFSAGGFHHSDEKASTGKLNQSLAPSFPAGSQDVPLRDVSEQKHVTSQLLDDDVCQNKSASSIIAPSEIAISELPLEMSNYLHSAGKAQHLESSPTTSPLFAASAANHKDMSQVTSQNKDVSVMSFEENPESRPTSVSISSNEDPTELQRKFKDLNFTETKNVVIPNHLQVPEVKKLGFCFGSFDAGFELDMNQSGAEENDRNPSMLSESPDLDDQPVKELNFRSKNTIMPAEDADREYSDYQKTPVQLHSSNSVEQTEPNSEVAQGSHPHSLFHNPSSYNHGLMQPKVSSQVAHLEGLDSHARDSSLLPGYIMPQTVDPASYYAQFYRSGFMDSDGRISPFHAAGVANKYNGNNSLILSQSAQTHQELQGSGQRVLPTASHPQLVTQAAGVMQSSIPATQKPLPIFRQTSGVHLPHYPPNFIPYAPYFSPFYVPPPTIHQFVSNGTFPQQPQTGSLYPSAPGTSSKYSTSQFKHGLNTGNPTHVGPTGSYGAYGLSTIGYTSGSSPPSVTPTSSEDAAVPHAKESNIYITPQQNEGSGAWFTTPSGDIGGVPASAFYNLPQGQLSFNPAQPGHGAFTGVFHPAQGVAAALNGHPIMQQSQPVTNHGDMAGPTGNVYQQPQHAQPNWPSNY